MENVKKPIDYIQEANLQDGCGALLTAQALDAINKLMVVFARDYLELRIKSELEAIDIAGTEEFETKTFGHILLPKEEINLNQ